MPAVGRLWPSDNDDNVAIDNGDDGDGDNDDGKGDDDERKFQYLP